MKKIVLGLFLSAAAMQACAESGAFVEGLLGSAKQTVDAPNGSSFSGDDFSFGVRGGYSFNSNFSLEVAYQQYGESDDSYVDEFGDYIEDQFSVSAFSAGLKGSIPFEIGLSLSARIGLALWDVEYEETDSSLPGRVFSADDDGNDPYYGLGAQWAFGDSFYVGAEYTITELDASVGEASFDHEVKNLAVFAGYQF